MVPPIGGGLNTDVNELDDCEAYAFTSKQDMVYGDVVDGGATHFIVTLEATSRKPNHFRKIPTDPNLPTAVRYGNTTGAKVLHHVEYTRWEQCVSGKIRKSVYSPCLVVEQGYNLISEEALIQSTGCEILTKADGKTVTYPDGEQVLMSKRGRLHWLPAAAPRPTNTINPSRVVGGRRYPDPRTVSPNKSVRSEGLLAIIAAAMATTSKELPPAGDTYDDIYEQFFRSRVDDSMSEKDINEHLQTRKGERTAAVNLSVAHRTKHPLSMTYLEFHQKHGHANHQVCQEMAKGAGITLTSNDRQHCGECSLNRARHKPMPTRPTKPKKPGEMLASDKIGPVAKSLRGNTLGFITTDPGTGRLRVWECGRGTCADAIAASEDYCLRAGIDPRELQHFQSDNGSEFCGEEFSAWRRKNQINARRSVPYRNRQNWWVELNIGSSAEQALTMLFAPTWVGLTVPVERLFFESLRYTCYLRSLRPQLSKEDKRSAHEKETGEGPQPLIDSIPAPFGARCYATKAKTLREAKVGAHGRFCFYVGVSEDHSDAYRLYDPKTRKIIISRDVYFDLDDSQWPCAVPFVDFDEEPAVVPENKISTEVAEGKSSTERASGNGDATHPGGDANLGDDDFELPICSSTPASRSQAQHEVSFKLNDSDFELPTTPHNQINDTDFLSPDHNVTLDTSDFNLPTTLGPPQQDPTIHQQSASPSILGEEDATTPKHHHFTRQSANVPSNGTKSDASTLGEGDFDLPQPAGAWRIDTTVNVDSTDELTDASGYEPVDLPRNRPPPMRVQEHLLSHTSAAGVALFALSLLSAAAGEPAAAATAGALTALGLVQLSSMALPANVGYDPAALATGAASACSAHGCQTESIAAAASAVLEATEPHACFDPTLPPNNDNEQLAYLLPGEWDEHSVAMLSVGGQQVEGEMLHCLPVPTDPIALR